MKKGRHKRLARFENVEESSELVTGSIVRSEKDAAPCDFESMDTLHGRRMFSTDLLAFCSGPFYLWHTFELTRR